MEDKFCLKSRKELDEIRKQKVEAKKQVNEISDEIVYNAVAKAQDKAMKSLRKDPDKRNFLRDANKLNNIYNAGLRREWRKKGLKNPVGMSAKQLGKVWDKDYEPVKNEYDKQLKKRHKVDAFGNEKNESKINEGTTDWRDELDGDEFVILKDGREGTLGGVVYDKDNNFVGYEFSTNPYGGYEYEEIKPEDIASLAESEMNEGAGAAVTIYFDYDPHNDYRIKSDIDTVIGENKITCKNILIADYYYAAHTYDGGYILFEEDAMKEAFVKDYNEYSRNMDDPEIAVNDIEEVHLGGYEHIYPIVFGGGWTRSKCEYGTVLDWSDEYMMPMIEIIAVIDGVEHSVTTECNGKYYPSDEACEVISDPEMAARGEHPEDFEDEEYDESLTAKKALAKSKMNEGTTGVKVLKDTIDDIEFMLVFDNGKEDTEYYVECYLVGDDTDTYSVRVYDGLHHDVNPHNNNEVMNGLFDSDGGSFDGMEVEIGENDYNFDHMGELEDLILDVLFNERNGLITKYQEDISNKLAEAKINEADKRLAVPNRPRLKSLADDIVDLGVETAKSVGHALTGDIFRKRRKPAVSEARLKELANKGKTGMKNKNFTASEALELSKKHLEERKTRSHRRKTMVIPFSFENPDQHSPADRINHRLIITKEQDGTFSWSETSNDESGKGFKSAKEAFDNAVSTGEFPLEDYDGFRLDAKVDLATFFNESKISKSAQKKKSKINEGYLGLPDVRYINHGNWSEAELAYKGFLYNETDVSDWAYADYEESESDLEFEDWVRENPDSIYGALYNLTPTAGYAIFDNDNNLVAIYGNEERAIKEAKKLGAEVQEDGFLTGYPVAKADNGRWVGINVHNDLEGDDFGKIDYNKDWAKAKFEESLSEISDELADRVANARKLNAIGAADRYNKIDKEYDADLGKVIKKYSDEEVSAGKANKEFDKVIKKYEPLLDTERKTIRKAEKNQELMARRKTKTNESKINETIKGNNLNSKWVIRAWMDNMDSEDGYDEIEFTKIGLIDFINSEEEDYYGDSYDYQAEPIEYDITDEELKTAINDNVFAWVFGDTASVVSIDGKPVNESMYNKYGEDVDPKEWENKEARGLNEAKSNEVNIFLTNLGKYNEGELVGEWVELPVDDFQPILDRIGINDEYEEWFITDYEAPFEINEYDNIEELNDIAREIQDFDSTQLEVLNAYKEHGYDMRDAIDKVIDNDYIYLEGDTEEDLAYSYIDMAGSFEDAVSKEDKQYYFDYEAYGRDLVLGGDYSESYDDEDNFLGYEDYEGNIVDVSSEKELGEYVIDDIFGGVDQLGDEEIERYFDYTWWGENLSYDFHKTDNGWVQLY